MNVERLLGFSRANKAIALLIKPIDVAHRISRGFLGDSEHPIDQFSEVLASFEPALGQLSRNRDVADTEIRLVGVFFDDEWRELSPQKIRAAGTRHLPERKIRRQPRRSRAFARRRRAQARMKTD